MVSFSLLKLGVSGTSVDMAGLGLPALHHSTGTDGDKAKSQFLNLCFEPFLSHHFLLLLLLLFFNTTEGILGEYGSLWNP